MLFSDQSLRAESVATSKLNEGWLVSGAAVRSVGAYQDELAAWTEAVRVQHRRCEVAQGIDRHQTGPIRSVRIPFVRFEEQNIHT